MDVVVSGVVTGDALEGVPGERVSAVAVDSLEGREGPEPDTLAERHEGGLKGDAGADSVEEEALKGMIVEGTVGIGDVEAVVSGVDSS